MKQKSKAVIISLPFYRLARVTLSEQIINKILKHANLFVISPFANDPKFTSNFNSKINHLYFDPPKGSRFISYIMFISEILRVNGYYHKYSKDIMSYYKSNENIKFGFNGFDTMHSFKHRILTFLFGEIGKFVKAWRILDNIFGSYYYTKSDYFDLFKSYDSVCLIQSSSWGWQDRSLNYFAKKFRYRKVLIPYTTDQLCLNGYLIGDFDSV